MPIARMPMMLLSMTMFIRFIGLTKPGIQITELSSMMRHSSRQL